MSGMGAIEIRRRIESAVERIGSIKAAAKEWGVHPSFVGAMVRGEKRPGRALCDRLGLPRPASNRGGKPDRGKMPGARIRGRRRPKAADLAPRPTAPAGQPPSEPRPRVESGPAAAISGAEDHEGQRRRAIEILEAKIGHIRPRPPSEPGMTATARAWRQMVREHLKREREIQAYGASLRERIAADEAEAIGSGSIGLGPAASLASLATAG